MSWQTRRWLLLLAPMLVWLLHFAAVYAFASLAALPDGLSRPGARAAVVAATLLGLAANLVLLRHLARHRQAAAQPPASAQRLTLDVARTAAWLSLAGIAWQGLPALLVG